MAGCAAVLGGLIALAAAQTPPADDAPSREMLLYLAEFGDAEDRYVDPAEVAAELDDDTKPADRTTPRNDRKKSQKSDAAAPADH